MATFTAEENVNFHKSIFQCECVSFNNHKWQPIYTRKKIPPPPQPPNPHPSFLTRKKVMCHVGEHTQALISQAIQRQPGHALWTGGSYYN